MKGMEGMKQWFLIVAFTVPRMMAALTISPFFGPQFIQGLARQVVTIALILTVIPVVKLSSEAVGPGAPSLFLMGVLVKEVCIGVLLGFASGGVFWIIQGAGFFIDNQRGSSMAEMFDPMSGESSSPFGLLFSRVIGVLFFIGGGFQAFLTVMYDSYSIWPVFTYFPDMKSSFPDTCLHLIDAMMSLIVVYAAPLIIAMFIAEFGLGLMNRFSPQLNVFFLAMPVKGGIASLMIILYLGILVTYAQRHYATESSIMEFYHGLFK